MGFLFWLQWFSVGASAPSTWGGWAVCSPSVGARVLLASQVWGQGCWQTPRGTGRPHVGQGCWQTPRGTGRPQCGAGMLTDPAGHRAPPVWAGMLSDPMGHRAPEFPWLKQILAASPPLLVAPANVAQCDVFSGTNIRDSCSVLRCPQLLTGLFGFSTAFPTGV